MWCVVVGDHLPELGLAVDGDLLPDLRCGGRCRQSIILSAHLFNGHTLSCPDISI